MAPGAPATLELTLTLDENASAGATDVSLSLDLDAALTGLVATGLPLSDVCGPGSTLSGTSSLTLAGGAVGVGQSCSFGVPLALPVDALPGTYTLTSSDVTANVAGVAAVHAAGSGALIVSGLTASKSFAAASLPGESVQLDYTLSNADATRGMTDIAFTDDFSAVISGLAAAGLPLSDVCGPGSQLSGTTSLSLSAGALAPGESCGFSVSLSVPASALAGEYGSVSSPITATLDAVAISSPPASSTLRVEQPLTLSKRFVSRSAAEGGAVELELRIENSPPSLPVTSACSPPASI